MLKKKATLGDKIAAQQTKVSRALEVFARAYEDVDAAQRELFSVIDTAEQQIQQLTKVLENAKTEFAANENLKAKLAEFTSEKK